jgi:predicted nucleic-acid-binding protein
MSDILDDETAAKIIKNIRQNEQESPHFQATIINFVYSLHQSDGGIDEIELEAEEVEEILDSMPTNPELELAHMD